MLIATFESSAVPGQHSAVKMTATAAAAVAEVMRMLRISTSDFLSRGAFGISYRPADPIKQKTTKKNNFSPPPLPPPPPTRPPAPSPSSSSPLSSSSNATNLHCVWNVDPETITCQICLKFSIRELENKSTRTGILVL